MTATELWYFRPDPAIEEVLEWSTEVLRCRTATQRIAHRSYPRITVRHQYVMTRADARRAELLARTQQTVWLPLWQDAGISSDVVVGDFIFWQQATAGQRYREGDYVALLGDTGTHEMLVIDHVSWIHSFAAVKTVTAATQEHPRVMVAPVIEASVRLRITRVSGDYALVRAQFVSTDLSFVVYNFGDVEIGTYRGADLMTFRPLADIDSDTGKEWLEIDGGGGRIERVPAYAIQHSAETVRWYLDQWNTVGIMRWWCYYLMGCRRQFWLPTFNHDFQPVSAGALSGTTLTVADCGYAAAFDPDAPGGSHLAIYGDDESWYAREITGVATGTAGVSEVVTVDEELPEVIPVMICQLRAMRMAADKAEWRYGGPGFGPINTDPQISTAVLSMAVVEEVPNPYVPVVEA